jgi:hypothetical protein
VPGRFQIDPVVGQWCHQVSVDAVEVAHEIQEARAGRLDTVAGGVHLGAIARRQDDGFVHTVLADQCA